MALRDERVTLAHGGGGKAMRDLIEEVFTGVFQPPGMEDAASLEAAALAEPGARLAFTTDGFVVTPARQPQLMASLISSMSAVSIKNFMMFAPSVLEKG